MLSGGEVTGLHFWKKAASEPIRFGLGSIELTAHMDSFAWDPSLEMAMLVSDTDDAARQLLQRLLLEMGLSANLEELDRRVEQDPAFLNEIEARALHYLEQRQRG